MNVLMRRLCLQHGMTSLIWASGRGHSEIAAALLNAGANPNAADKVSELTVGTPHCFVTEMCLGRGGEGDRARRRVYVVDMYEGVAVRSAFVWLVRMNCRSNQIVVCTFQYGTTSLVWAARKGHVKVIHTLLAQGADVNIAGTVSYRQ